jgi:hypothetical protein
VATQPYKITFTDGSTQVLPKVWKQYADREFLVFQDEVSEVFRAPAKSIRSVVRTDLPGEEPPEVIIG